MKKSLFIFAALTVMVIAYTKMVACPDNWKDSGTQTITYNGCTYEYSYCYGLINGLHCISISEIIILPPCTGSDFENNPTEITESILIAILTTPDITKWAGYEGGIPECPDGFLCTIKIYDAICYNGWIPFTRYNEDLGTFEIVITMNKCDNEPRSCNETIYICWDAVNQKYQMYRAGYETGPECPEPCAQIVDINLINAINSNIGLIELS